MTSQAWRRSSPRPAAAKRSKTTQNNKNRSVHAWLGAGGTQRVGRVRENRVQPVKLPEFEAAAGGPCRPRDGERTIEKPKLQYSQPGGVGDVYRTPRARARGREALL